MLRGRVAPSRPEVASMASARRCCYSVLTSHEVDWSILLPLIVSVGFILLAIPFMAALLFKLRTGGFERVEG